MTTTEFKTLMSRHLLGIADADEEKQLQEVLQSDSEKQNIASEFCKLKDFSDKFGQYKQIDSKIAFDKFTEVVNQETFVDKKLVSTSRWWRGTVAVVAAVLIPLIVFTTVIYFFYTKADSAAQLADTEAPYTSIPPSRENPLLRSEEETMTFFGFDKDEEEVPALRTISTTRANYRDFTLDDGTHIHLNACSSVTYPEHFADDSREVELNGEGYFEVAKDAHRPFIVHVAGYDVKQYGTEYNINAYDSHNVTVTLVNGSIGISARGGKEQRLTPDHSAQLTPSGINIFADDVMLATEWMHGTHHFERQSVRQLTTLLQRMYPQGCNLTDETGTLVTGVFNREDDLSDIVDAINNITSATPICSDEGAKDQQTRRVTMSLKGVNARTFLDILHKKTGVSYVFNADEINLMDNIYIKVQNEPLENTLNRVFANSKFQYHLRGNVLTIKYNSSAPTTPPVSPSKRKLI